MSAKVRQIKDKDGTKIYPVTKAGACFMPNGKDTVERILNDEIDQDTDSSPIFSASIFMLPLLS